MTWHTATARVFLFISFLGLAVSLGSGGLPLPPFKSVPWLVTPSSTIGLYGGCPSSVIDPTFWSFQPDYKDLLLQCSSIFISDTNSLLGSLSFVDSVIAFSLHAVGFVLILAGLFSIKSLRPLTGLVHSILALLFTGSGFGFAVYRFYWIRQEINRDTNVSFGYGLYIDAGVCGLLVIVVCLLTSARVAAVNYAKQRWGP